MLQNLSKILTKRKLEIDDWFDSKLSHRRACFYSSVDIRYSGNKLVAVDTNLFPAGFNNLNQEQIQNSSAIVKKYVEHIDPSAKNILLISENHTRNIHYSKNIDNLAKIICLAGFSCLISNLDTLDNIENIDLIILNNDLSLGIPEILKNTKIPIIPHPQNGWFNRRKSLHFKIYNQLAEELEKEFLIPKDFISTNFLSCTGLDFKNKIGLDGLKEKAHQLFESIKGNKKDPFIFVKSDNGTYGMGVIMIKSVEEIENLNKKKRKAMQVSKNNLATTEVILQEGIETIERINGEIAEPLLYHFNNQLVSFLYRTHADKDEFSSLNSVGMKIINNVSVDTDYANCCKFVAKLASVAACLELNE